MFDIETTARDIEVKVSKLTEEVTRLRRMVAEKEEQCKALSEAHINDEKTINKLTEENKIIKLGNRLMEKEESAELKVRINQMIRAIDKSLALLNKTE